MSFHQLPFQSFLGVSLPHVNSLVIPGYGPGIRKLGAFMDMFTPTCIHPNLISLTAFLGVFAPICFAMISHLQAPLQPLPGYWQLILAAGYLIYETLDELDGIHARSTGQTSRLGAFIDDAIDCWGCSIGLFGQLYFAIWLPLAPWQVVALFGVFMLGSFDNCQNYFLPRTASTGDDIPLKRHLMCLTHVLVYFLGVPAWLYWFWTGGLLCCFFAHFATSLIRVGYTYGLRWVTVCYLLNHFGVTVFATWFVLNPATSSTDRWYMLIAVAHALFLLQFVLLTAAFVCATQVYGTFEAIWPAVICLLSMYNAMAAMAVSLVVVVAVTGYCLAQLHLAEKAAALLVEGKSPIKVTH